MEKAAGCPAAVGVSGVLGSGSVDGVVELAQVAGGGDEFPFGLRGTKTTAGEGTDAAAVLGLPASNPRWIRIGYALESRWKSDSPAPRALAPVCAR